MKTNRLLSLVVTIGLFAVSCSAFSEVKLDPGPPLTPDAIAAAAELQRRGALVQPISADVNWRYVSLRGIDKPDAATIALLAKLPTIVELDLSGKKLGPEDLAALSGLKALRKLNLASSTVNDAGLTHFVGMERLESLNLFKTGVTDAGLATLHGLKSLKRVYLFETQVTDAGADSLAKALPGLRVNRGWDKVPAPAAPKPSEPQPEPPKPVPALTAAKPEEVGLDAGKVASIRAAMDELIKQNRGAGVVTLIAKDGRLVHHEAVGMAHVESERMMSPDAIFWIASMTKNVTAAAVMMLVDEGKLNLDEPAQKWVPELANVKIASGAGLSRPVTLRDLLSHSSGIPDPPRDPTNGNVPLAQYAVDILREPFSFNPGERFEYGFGPTIAGRCIEVAAGKPYAQFVQERILTPLGMTDTTFSPDAAQRARIARTYKLNGDRLVPAHNSFLTSEPDVKREAEPSGGLFSTARDMALFYEMIRQGGQLNGKRYISETGVAEMTKSHTMAGKLIQYGLGWFTNGAEQKVTPAFSDRSFGHGGAFGTHGWVDPERKMTVVFMVQNVLVPKGDELRNKFCELAAGAAK